MLLTIEITDEQHNYMKTSAVLKGMSINEYVIDRAMSDSIEVSDEDEDIKGLMEFLKPRIEEAKRGEVANISISEIIENTIRKKQRNE